MRRKHQGRQIVAYRERDLNTDAQFAGSILFAIVGHVFCIFTALVGSLLFTEENIITPGHRVDFVSLAPAMAPKPAPPPRQKKQIKTPKKIAKVAPVKPKKIVRPKGKKIVPIKEKAPKKIEPIEKPKPRKTPTLVKEKTRVPTLVAPAGATLSSGQEVAFQYYIDMITFKANENWDTFGIDVTTKRTNPMIRFEVVKNGSVENIRMERSSGSQELDQSAIAAVRALDLPPLPDEYREQEMKIRFTFDYEQNQQ